MYITRNHSAKVQLADSLKTIHDHIATLLSNIDIMSNSAATRTGEDDNLVLTILARVPYEGRPYHQFRGVNRRFNRLMGDGGRHATALPTMVARRQFTPFYQLGNAIGPRGGYEWEGLHALWARVTLHDRWLDLVGFMDRENTEAYFTAMALVDAIVAFKNLRLTRGFVSAADRQLFDGLNLAGLAKVVLPPPALMLIRYLCMRTGDALQSRLRRDPVAELTSEGGNNADLEASCLCRSILFTTQIITASGTPFRMFLNNQGFFSGLYNVQHDLTMDLVAHLEDPNLDNSECRDGMVLQLVLDQALKKEMLTDEERRLPIKEVVADDIDKWTGITGVADRLQFEHDHDTQTQSDDAQRDADQDTSIQGTSIKHQQVLDFYHDQLWQTSVQDSEAARIRKRLATAYKCMVLTDEKLGPSSKTDQQSILCLLASTLKTLVLGCLPTRHE